MRQLLVGGLGVLLLTAACSSPKPVASSSASASVTPTATPRKASPGDDFLAKARAAWKRKDYQTTSIQADLAAGVLSHDPKAPRKLLIEAHSLAGQAYARRQIPDKALPHYTALVALDPKNAEYLQVKRQLEGAVRRPASSSEIDPARLSRNQSRREEHRLNEYIDVAIKSPYGGTGRTVRMTRGKYEELQRAGGTYKNGQELNY